MNSSDIIFLFNQLFEVPENTILIGGAPEPLYLPADPPHHEKHRIFFRLDYCSSALHEVAHWCLAGKKRRLQEDYGYWYKPDGRDNLWQARFETAEVKPQALECLFSQAAGVVFRISADNLAYPDMDTARFQAAVEEQVGRYREKGLPPRARLFRDALLTKRKEDRDES